MNIVDFYRELSAILEMCREQVLSHSESQFRLNELISKAELAGLDVKVSDDILNIRNLVKYDDEMSYDEGYSYESSYEEESDYESSYEE